MVVSGLHFISPALTGRGNNPATRKTVAHKTETHDGECMILMICLIPRKESVLLATG